MKVLYLVMVVPYSKYSPVTCSKLWILFNRLTVLKPLHYFIPHLSAAFLGPHDAICSLMLSNKPLTPLQNNGIYTDIKLNILFIN